MLGFDTIALPSHRSLQPSRNIGLFERLKEEGKIKHLGISVEKVSEATQGITFENVSTVQIIFNLFRQKPAEQFFDLAQQNNVGIIARVPLASGLLTGKFNAQSTFTKDDHRFLIERALALTKEKLSLVYRMIWGLKP